MGVGLSDAIRLKGTKKQGGCVRIAARIVYSGVLTVRRRSALEGGRTASIGTMTLAGKAPQNKDATLGEVQLTSDYRKP